MAHWLDIEGKYRAPIAMEPRIQYAKTSDGVSIAYATAGEGRCIIGVPSPPLTHVQRQSDIFPGFYQGLAQRFRSTRYDFRGSGLSDRDSIDFSMSAMLRDLEAVADRAGGSEFAMYTVNDGGPIAISYAAANPERLSHLVLIDSWARFSDYTQSPAIQAETMLRAQDWMIYTETVAKVLIGYEDPGFAESLAEHIRASVEPEALRAAYSRIQDGDWDVYQQDCHNGAHDCPDAAPYSRSRARPLRDQPRKALPSRRVKGYRSDT